VKTDTIDNELCAVHVRVPRATEIALKAIARQERESLATIIRASLRQTAIRGAVELAFAGIAPSIRESVDA
jgi:hypothetical protein